MKINKKKQNGGDVISASTDLINSMISLGNSIFFEIDAITHINQQLNNGVVPAPGVPNTLSGPPPFTAPQLN